MGLEPPVAVLAFAVPRLGVPCPACAVCDVDSQTQQVERAGNLSDSRSLFGLLHARGSVASRVLNLVMAV